MKSLSGITALFAILFMFAGASYAAATGVEAINLTSNAVYVPQGGKAIVGYNLTLSSG
ncbi:Uncharacterised protein [uncultured archaeon]|nr:Uncharacterised protein [uncultured archaeon]